jgi:carbonic anhydrase/acetyltransferase-like protein (isoleucine patch superfamily)
LAIGHGETFPVAKSLGIVGATAIQPAIFGFTVPFFAKSSIAAQLSRHHPRGALAVALGKLRRQARGVASRTVVGSVVSVSAPPSNLLELEARLEGLRARFPGALFQRYLEQLPRVAQDVYVAPGAALIGSVELAAGASIWHACVLRADLNPIQVGARSNVQDGSVVHVGDRDPAIIGADVVVGHRAVIHGCRIEDGVLVGIQSTILDGCVIGHGSVIAAGAVVTAGTHIPARSLVVGVPGKVKRELTEADEIFHRELAAKYVRIAHNYRHG